MEFFRGGINHRELREHRANGGRVFQPAFFGNGGLENPPSFNPSAKSAVNPKKIFCVYCAFCGFLWVSLERGILGVNYFPAACFHFENRQGACFQFTQIEPQLESLAQFFPEFLGGI